MARNSLHHPTRLTVLRVYRKYAYGSMRMFCWCRCTCGNEKEIAKSSIDSGLTRSCGCLHREVQVVTGARSNLTHGHDRKGRVSPEYHTWHGMIKTLPYTNRQALFRIRRSRDHRLRPLAQLV
jgi:hypothetical protein